MRLSTPIRFDHSEALYARSSRDSHAIFACRYTSLLERRRRRTRVKERWIYDEFSWLNRMASLGWTRYRGTSEILDDGADVGGGRRDLESDGNTVSRDLVTFVLPCLEIVWIDRWIILWRKFLYIQNVQLGNYYSNLIFQEYSVYIIYVWCLKRILFEF